MLCFPVIVGVLIGQARAEEPPAAGRPGDFSWVVGTYRISASAAPLKVEVEQPITLKVVIQGNGPEAYWPRQDKLKIFRKECLEDFFIEPVPDQTKATPEKEVWEFVYRLRPRHENVEFIPRLTLWTYHPARRKYQPSTADAIPIMVLRAKTGDVAIEPLKVVEAPESFFRLRTTQEDGAASGHDLALGYFFLALAAVPVVCLCWLAVARRLYPNEHLMRQKRRSRAAQDTLRRLAEPEIQGQLASVNEAVTSYLRARLDFSALEPTGREIARFRGRLGLGKKDQAAWQGWFDACHAQRFGAEATDGARLSERAAGLIQTLEEDACLPAA